MGPTQTGVFDLATLAADMPMGAADDTVDSQQSAQVGANLYERICTATVVATFRMDGTVDTSLTRLLGQKLGLPEPSAMNDVSTITLTDALIKDTSLAGRTYAAPGDILKPSGAQTTSLTG
jgi:hypothetical protein